MCPKSSAAVSERKGGCVSWGFPGKASRCWGHTADVGFSTSSEAEQETFRTLIAEFALVTWVAA